MDNQENYNQRLENLSKEVDNVTETPKNVGFINDFVKKNTKYFFIGGIPFIITLLLIITKSSLITKEDKENPEKKKLDFVKIIVYFFILILLTFIGLYVYNYKKN